MKKSEVKVGGHYLAKVSGAVTTVRVDAIRERSDYKGRETTAYDVTNLRTGRRTTFRSAAKFRDAVSVCNKCGKPFTVFRGGDEDTCLKCLEGGPRSIMDPHLNDDPVENGYYRCNRCSFSTKRVGEMAEHERRNAGHNLEFVERPTKTDERCNKWVSDNDPSGPTSERCKKPAGHTGPCGGFTVGDAVGTTEEDGEGNKSVVDRIEMDAVEPEGEQSADPQTVPGAGKTPTTAAATTPSSVSATATSPATEQHRPGDDGYRPNHYRDTGECWCNDCWAARKAAKKAAPLTGKETWGEVTENQGTTFKGDEKRGPFESASTTPETAVSTPATPSAVPSTASATVASTIGPTTVTKPAGLAAKLAGLRMAEATAKDTSVVAGMTPTEEQRAGLDEAIRLFREKVLPNGGPRALVMVAGAGSGKTAECKMLENVLDGRGQYTAFNSSLVADSKPKFKRASCRTTHSLAFGAVGKRFAHRLGGPRVRSEEIAKALGIEAVRIDTGEVDERGQPRVKTLTGGYLAGQVVAAVTRFCQSADRQIDARHFRFIEGIDPMVNGERTYTNNDRVKEYLVPFAEKAWADLANPQGTLPYKHDHYVKLWQLGEGNDRPVIAADYILLDEYQDTAPVFLDILMKQTHALLVLVGDDNQRIYEWRGAVNAGDYFPNAPRCMLSQSFRFGQIVADVANSVLRTLDEPTKLVMKGAPGIPSRVGKLTSPRCVLCRTNAAAVGAVLRAKEEGKRAHLIGGAAEVVSFVKAARQLQIPEPTSHPELGCFSDWKEVQEYAKTDEGEDLKLLVKLIDEFGCDEIIAALEHMPKEQDADFIASTAHKCVHPDTLVETPDGLIPIRDIAESGIIATPDGPREYYDKFVRGTGLVLTISTERGYEVKVTPDHGITVWRNGSHDRVEAQDITPGDWVRVMLGSTVRQDCLPQLPSATSGDVREKDYSIPREMSSELAEFLGLMVADGVMIYRRGRPCGFRLGKRYMSVVMRFVSLVRLLFGYEARLCPMEGGTAAEVQSTFIARWLDSFDGVQPHAKHVPPEVLRSPVEFQAAFLRGLFEDGSVHVKAGVVDTIQWNNYDYEVVGVVQTMLLRQGIVSSRRWAHGIGWLYLYSQHAKRFAEQIGFVADEKNAKLVEFGEDRHCLIPLTRAELLPLEAGMSVTNKQNARARGYISRNVAEKVITALGHQRASVLVERMRWSYERIASVDEASEGDTICITVPNGSRFLQNGFDGWNSKGREWDTVKLAGDFPTANKMTDSDRRLLYVACTRARLVLDISSCPTFTGAESRGANSNDDSGEPSVWVPGLSIKYTVPMPSQADVDAYLAAAERKVVEARAKVPAKEETNPPAHVQNDSPAPRNGNGGQFTWSKHNSGWAVRGPAGQKVGTKVIATRRNGATSIETIKEVVARYPEAWLYRV